MNDPGEAAQIVGHASRRGLGTRPGLRNAAAMVWAAFLGATASTAVLMLLPDQWLSIPMSFDRLAIIFGVAFALALIPAATVCLLMGPRPAARVGSVEIDDGR